MVKKYVFNPLLISILFNINTLVLAQTWKLERNSEGVKVFSREVAGSAFLELKAETVINSRLEVIGFVLRDVPANTQWVSECIKSEIVSKKDENNFTVYMVQALPFPYDDRDMVLTTHTIIDYRKGKVEIQLHSVNDKNIKKNSDYVRINKLKASYLLEYIDRNHTKVTYTVYAEPGGNLSASLVNTFSKHQPYETLIGLKKMTGKQKYIQQADSSEDKKTIEKLISDGVLK